MRTTLEKIERQFLYELEQEEQRTKERVDYFKEVILPLSIQHEKLLGEGFSHMREENIRGGYFARNYYFKSIFVFGLIYRFGNGGHKLVLESRFKGYLGHPIYLDDELLTCNEKTYILDIAEIQRHIIQILSGDLK